MMSSSGRTPRASFSGGSSFSAAASFKSPKIRQERNTNFKVVIRVRPPLPRELSGDVNFRNVVAVDDREQTITVSDNIEAVVDNEGNLLANPGPYSTYSFAFDYVYDPYCTQEKVYETTARTVVDSALQGYNATIFAYGQTGSGKTYTMEGFNREGNVEARGIIPRAIEQIFNHIQRYASPRMRFLVRASYLQIYNEQISDLLKPDRNNLHIREDKRRGVYVDGLSEWVVRSPAEIYGLMERGAAVRATGETRMNELSSRSHAVFIVIAEQSETVYVDDRGNEMAPEEFQRFMHKRGIHRENDMARMEDHIRQTFKVGKLNLVDLAGSERVERSGATGQRLEESKQINKSLTMLGYVISALTEAKDRQHIPYRNSKLTRMLEDSLGGNCKTTMMAMISPAMEAMLETISTLKFANRAKNIKNEAKVNEDLDQKSLLRKYERELKQLRAELEERSKNVVDKRRLLELDEQRRRAEADKMAAIRALEARSLEFMHEKEEKKKLEARISQLMNQMIRGHNNGEGSSNKLNSSNNSILEGSGEVVKEQQDKLRQEYEYKLADLEKERESIEEEKAQVDRYKQLLLKQRDIMIALTQRLVERDEQIMALQDELDAYDRHHKELEEKLDEKTALCIKLQRISMEVNATSPNKNDELTKAIGESWKEKEKGVSNSNKSVSSAKSNRRVNSGPTEVTYDDEATLDPERVEAAVKNELEAFVFKLPDSAAKSQLVNELKIMTQKAMESMGNSVSEKDNAALQLLREENEKLRQQLNKAKNSTDTELSTLQGKCETLVKEREAVQTILEQKIKVLVQSVAQTASAVTTSGAVNGSTAGQALTKDVAALQRLVNASIAALRNAAASSGSNASSSSSAANNTNTSSNSMGSNSLPPPPPPMTSLNYSSSYSAPPPPPSSNSYSSYGGSNAGPLHSSYSSQAGLTSSTGLPKWDS